MNKPLSDLFLPGLLTCLLATGFSTSAFASSVHYNINSSNPALSGAFYYDANNASSFSDFEISILFSGQTWSLAQEQWNKFGQIGPMPDFSNYTATLSLDLTDWANHKTIISSCEAEWCINTPAEAFSLLTTNPVNWSAALMLTPTYEYFLNFGNYSQPYSSVMFPVSDKYPVDDYNFNIVYDQEPYGSLFQNTIGGTFNASPVPEPSTCAMLLAGLGLFGFASRRRTEGKLCSAAMHGAA